MRKFLIFNLLLITFSLNATAQDKQDFKEIEDTSWKNIYRDIPAKENELVHTKLVASFNYTNSQLNGEAWLNLRPYLNATSTLSLDAKGMDIHQVGLMTNNKTTALKYTYDGLIIKIQLDKTYKPSEKYTVFIKYTAKPNEFKSKGSAAINDAKGLYFINPMGKDSSKPIQIWTQGETEGTSVWLPIIDKPNQKSTQEFQLTVPSKYVSLSNGLLTKQINNKNGTRLDIWKMDLPHAPYLFFLAVGDYTIVKDTYKAKEVSYYVEKEYEKEARQIYGKTPAMIAYYETILGIDFPWAKYAQISGREFVSGAMENTTATMHNEMVLQDARELKDGNAWEGTIAHELFHHWFGDLVTAESWSNITVNESFADYSQTLWLEHSKGKDAGEYENYTGLRYYLSSPADAEKDLVRFFYKEREDVFDLVSYQKGGRILNMLRHLVGDKAFFASLHTYLEDNKFGSGTAFKLKLAFEKVTGKDLNWFFNQWYFGSGHPYVRIEQKYMPTEKKVLIIIQQNQLQNKTFTLPIGIDVYVAGQRNHYEVWNKNRIDSFYFDAATIPDNVNVDNDKTLLWFKDESKTMSEYAFQYFNARNFIDRLEAINEAAENLTDTKAQAILKAALKDSFYIIRAKAIQSYNPTALDEATENIFIQLANTDPSSEVREQAINALSGSYNEDYIELFTSLTKDSSYIVSGAALDALEKIDSSAALSIATRASNQKIKKRLNTSVTAILAKYGDENIFDFIAKQFEVLNTQSAEKFYMTVAFGQLLHKVNNPIKFKKGIDLIVKFRESIPKEYRSQSDPYFNIKVLGEVLKAKKTKGQQDLVDIVLAVIPKM
ncbi:MAG: M1 family metallopeptidase [Chitinophagaceae bacterium]|nr:M1 family metallopeptidase [Chitinophagaceae bacterium]